MPVSVVSAEAATSQSRRAKGTAPTAVGYLGALSIAANIAGAREGTPPRGKW